VPELWVANLGRIPYDTALELQERLREARQADAIPDVLLLLEHPAVYTRGRRSGDDELPLGESFYSAQGIDCVEVDRGGRVTYHGPGQLVGYPIMRIGDVIGALRKIEQAIIEALRDEGLAARGGDPRPTGVWVGERKIASLGLHISRRVTTHGFAVNVNNDLAPFDWIVPCGMPEVEMTSVARELGAPADADCFRRRIAHRFAAVHERRQRLVSPAALQARIGAALAG
jgi:lipoyl(octanoyl) transferase